MNNKKMALDVNKEYKEIYNIDFFTFIDTPCLEPAKDLPPWPEYLIKIRKELETDYKDYPPYVRGVFIA